MLGARNIVLSKTALTLVGLTVWQGLVVRERERDRDREEIGYETKTHDTVRPYMKAV